MSGGSQYKIPRKQKFFLQGQLCVHVVPKCGPLHLGVYNTTFIFIQTD